MSPSAPDLAFDNYAGGVLALANTGGTSDVLISSPNPSRLHQKVTFKAAVKATVKGSPGGTPTGSVIFEDNGSALATVTLQNGVATYQTSALGVGTHQITAVYLGDSNFNPNVSQTLVQIVKL